MKLYHKILILVFIQLLAVFCFGIYQIQMLYLSQKTFFEERVKIETNMIQTRLDDVVENVYKTADILLNSEEIMTGILSNDSDVLYNWGRLFIPKYCDEINFVTNKGIVIARGSDEFKFGDTIKETRYFKQVLEDDHFFGVEVLGGKEFLILVKQIHRKKDDSPVGIIVIGVEINAILLNKMILGTHMTMAYSSSIRPYMQLSQLQKYPLIIPLDKGSVENVAFNLDLSSQMELNAIVDMRARLLVGFMIVFLLFFVFVRLVLLRHLKNYNELLRLLFSFYDDKIENKQFIHATKEIAKKCNSSHEVQKIGEVLAKITQKMVDAQKSLASLSETDHLTQIANRHKLEDIVEQKLKEATRGVVFSIIFLDIDKFKKINDTLGHDIGDVVLQKIAQILITSMRESDIVGRWGGEEFLIILPATHNEGALVSASILRKKIAYSLLIEDTTITASLGVATYREGDEMRTLIKRADDALYRAKNSGRNRVENESH